MTATTHDAVFRAILAEDRHHRPEAFACVTGQLFRGVNLEGARVLEIGSGRGLQAIYMAQRGAIVTSLEPEAVGSTTGVLATQRARCQRLGLSVEVVNADFNAWQTDGRFDVILSRSSINHLYPTECHALQNASVRASLVMVLRHVRSLLEPGGVFIATDASRYGFFALARRWVRRPWHAERLGVNWRHHQTPYTWRRLLIEAGFSRITVAYPVPYRLRHVHHLANTAVAAFFLRGSFILQAR